MGLSKRVYVDGLYAETIVNVWDLTTKQIVFTGNTHEAANYVGVSSRTIYAYLAKKTRYKKKFTFRIKPQAQ